MVGPTLPAARWYSHAYVPCLRSCLFVKNRNQLTDALSVDAPYLRNHQSLTSQITDYRHWQIPLSRRFRALKIWFVMRTYGLNGFKAYIRNHIVCADLFSSLVASRPDLFKIVTTPAFALTALQIVSSSSASASNNFNNSNNNNSLARANARTKAVYEAVYQQGEILVTSTVVEGLYIIRVVCANPKTEAKYMRLAFEMLVNATEHLFEEEVAQAASQEVASQQVVAKL